MFVAGAVTKREDEAGVWYFLARAQTLGMFVARTDEEQELLHQIRLARGGEGTAAPAAKPAGELALVSDAEYTTVRSTIIEKFKPLKEAYMRGMVIARDDEQREVLAELLMRVGPPRDS